MNEFDLIKQFFVRHTNVTSVAHGIGDDCAVVAPPEGQKLVLSIDTQIAGCHFPENAAPNLIAARALHCAISDLAAMGADPLWFTLALSLPSSNTEWLRGFSEGLFEAADLYNIALIGGDTTNGPLTISIQVHGAVAEKDLLLRSGAHIGDKIFVTGTLGDGRGGLECVLDKLETTQHNRQYLLARFYQPQAQIRSGILLRGLASSCIDISDGLLADLGHICSINQVGAQVDCDLLPISGPLRESVPSDIAIEWALNGGDDYQLCFTANPMNAKQLVALFETSAFDIHMIGEVVEGNSIRDTKTGKEFPFKHEGYSHF